MLMDETRLVYSVSQITREIRKCLNHNFQTIWVNGEITNNTKASSGHMYFSLKDENTQIQCVMFNSHNKNLSFEMANGLNVIVFGKVEVYPARGTLQIIVESAEPAGIGNLQLKFEQLKEKLINEGLFDAKNKKDIPNCPQKIGIITSHSGAALQDTLTTLKKRYAQIEIIIYPSVIQGINAVDEINKQLEVANLRKEVDVLLLIRGGGSTEDLQAFNEEKVARAIFASQIPIVSGIGHETDFTIADFVSDYRAPTPTAAAVKVSPDINVHLNLLKEMHIGMNKLIHNHINNLAVELSTLKKHLYQTHPTNLINDRNQQLDSMHRQLNLSIHNTLYICRKEFEHNETLLLYNAPINRINNTNHRLDLIAYRINSILKTTLISYRKTIDNYEFKLKSFNPNAVLQRGFALVRNQDGDIITSSKNVKLGQKIDIRLANGKLKALVNDIKKSKST